MSTILGPLTSISRTLEERGISYDDIGQLIDGTSARRKLLLIDTCHAGEMETLPSSRNTVGYPERISPNVVTRDFTREAIVTPLPP